MPARALRPLTSFAAAAAVLASLCVATSAADCPEPKRLSFAVDGEITRDALGLTQGLEQHGDVLFESTGAIAGTTRLNTIDRNGRVTTLVNLGTRVFGEGLTILGEQVFQLTWQDRKVFVYDLKGALLREMRNPREGWGLTNDGSNLIFTDGGDRLYFADPATFAIARWVQVRLGARPLPALNELENVDGKIFANVFMTKNIVRVDPGNGCVEALADLSSLWSQMSKAEIDRLNSDSNFVLNGIAYDRGSRRFYVTGKNWRTIFIGRFIDAF